MDRQTSDKHQTDIATYRLNRPGGRFSENKEKNAHKGFLFASGQKKTLEQRLWPFVGARSWPA